VSLGLVVAHPGTQHSYETALAAQEAGLLELYVTGFYFKPRGYYFRLLKCLPCKVRTRVSKELYRRWKDGLNPERIRIFPLGELFYLFAAKYFGFSMQSMDRILRWRNEQFDRIVAGIIEKENPDGLICYNGCALSAFKRGKLRNVICILDQSIAHIKTGLKLLREEAEINPDFADSMRWQVPAWLVERSSEEALLADYILAGSEFVKNSLTENGVEESRIFVFPYGADLKQFQPSYRTDRSRFRLLFVGQISQRKGIKYLLEAVKRLRIPNLELTLVGNVIGSGNGLAKYQEYFKHVPNVPHSEVHSYFHDADAFVYPSLYEGSSIAIYEALASGLPVITTLNSGSVVRDGADGFIVPIRNVEAIKEKILLLYENADLRMEISRNARKRAEEFSWQAYRKRVGGFLQNVLSTAKQQLA